MIIQLSHFSPFSLASLSLLFRVLFIYFPFIYFLFLFPPVGALLFLQGGAFFLPLHFRRDEWFGLAPVLGGCDGFFFCQEIGSRDGIVRWMLLLLDGLGSFDGCAVRDGTCAALYGSRKREREGRRCVPFPRSLFI